MITECIKDKSFTREAAGFPFIMPQFSAHLEYSILLSGGQMISDNLYFVIQHVLMSLGWSLHHN